MAFEFVVSDEAWEAHKAQLISARDAMAARLGKSERRDERIRQRIAKLDEEINRPKPYSVRCRNCGRLDVPSEARTDVDCCRGCGSDNVSREE